MKHKTPLAAVPNAVAPGVSGRACQPQGSPYMMQDSKPQQYFVSGKGVCVWGGGMWEGQTRHRHPGAPRPQISGGGPRVEG